MEKAHEIMLDHKMSASKWANQLSGVTIANDYKPKSAFEMMKYNKVKIEDIIAIMDNPILNDLPRRVKQKLQVQGSYQGFISKENAYIRAFKADESLTLPLNFNYKNAPTLSTEVVNLLNEVKPETIGQARRIQGVTPAAIFELYRISKQQQRLSKSEEN
ncbi:unnamed protein product [Ambrosiozyma monospora]|uniref:Unnamed protein product n=1 Tax=Ambrosiozyma monospora TaxID=43982 RepID=A0A9W6YVA7_AMBMO|nr:unnamed protein product [Ambrosiozyma monospora]